MLVDQLHNTIPHRIEPTNRTHRLVVTIIANVTNKRENNTRSAIVIQYSARSPSCNHNNVEKTRHTHKNLKTIVVVDIEYRHNLAAPIICTDNDCYTRKIKVLHSTTAILCFLEIL